MCGDIRFSRSIHAIYKESLKTLQTIILLIITNPLSSLSFAILTLSVNGDFTPAFLNSPSHSVAVSSADLMAPMIGWKSNF